MKIHFIVVLVVSYAHPKFQSKIHNWKCMHAHKRLVYLFMILIIHSANDMFHMKFEFEFMQTCQGYLPSFISSVSAPYLAVNIRQPHAHMLINAMHSNMVMAWQWQWLLSVQFRFHLSVCNAFQHKRNFEYVYRQI